MFSTRSSASRGVFACTVAIEPSWPVFIACSMSKASSPRTSPRMMRSGRMRSALRTRARCATSPRPSTLGGRVSRRTTCGCCSCSSAASSIVTMRSCVGMKADSTFSVVVLPLPVPPEISRFSFARTIARSSCAMAGVSVPRRTRSSTVSGTRENLRIDSAGPSSASGGMIAFTREPSGSRASTMGLDSSTRRPTRETMRSMMRSRWRSSSKRTGLRSSRPARSTHTSWAPLTRMSQTPASASSGSSGPRPITSCSMSMATWRCSLALKASSDSRSSRSMSTRSSSRSRAGSSARSASRSMRSSSRWYSAFFSCT